MRSSHQTLHTESLHHDLVMHTPAHRKRSSYMPGHNAKGGVTSTRNTPIIGEDGPAELLPAEAAAAADATAPPVPSAAASSNAPTASPLRLPVPQQPAPRQPRQPAPQPPRQPAPQQPRQ